MELVFLSYHLLPDLHVFARLSPPWFARNRFPSYSISRIEPCPTLKLQENSIVAYFDV